MSLNQKRVLLSTLLFVAISITGCEKEGTVEKAGKEVDKTFNAVKEKIHEATK